MSEWKDSPLQFPDVAPVDHTRKCPKYTNILNRHQDDGIAMEELDALQMELEHLLASASQRMRQFKSETKVLSDNLESRKDKKVSRGKDTEHKRSRVVEDRPVKKMKTESGHNSPHMLKSPASHLNSSTSSPGGAGRSKAKGSLLPKPLEPEIQEDQPVTQRSADVPNKFWQLVDTYCGPIPQETISLLEKMEKPLPEDYFEIPALGKHFSQVWAEEDLASEEREGGRLGDLAGDKSSVEKIMKKTKENLEEVEPCPFGSLTQRLVSAFVQENIMAPPDTGADSKPFENITNSEQNNSPKAGKASSAPHTTKLEARIKAELIEQGLLDAPSDSDKDEDEVLAELKRCQQELRAINERNRTIVSQLMKLAKDDMKKQDLRTRIDAANSEVMEHYRRVLGARQKKRNLMKKEKESAMKVLKERDSLVKQLEQLG